MFFKKSDKEGQNARSNPEPQHAASSQRVFTTAPMQIEDGRSFGDPYDLLVSLSPGLLPDIGAAVGSTTLSMRKRSLQSRVISFQPDLASRPYFDKMPSGVPKVTLIKPAAPEKPGTVRFAPSRAAKAGIKLRDFTEGADSTSL
jgi:hypothetical protein